MTETLTIAVTGAGGFIGRHTVAAARNRGHRVRALVRRSASADPSWAEDPMVDVITLDLTDDGAGEAAAVVCDDADAVIHAAAAMRGDDAAQLRQTVEPTRVMLDAVAAASKRPRFILVSSISVYGSDAASEGSLLDETTAREMTPATRDAYCRAKLAQEDLVLDGADMHGLDVRILRPGAVFGPNRLWNGHLGHALGPILVRLESRGEVPVSFIENCAEALVLAAERPLTRDDRSAAQAGGRVEIINVIDDDRPDRRQYIAALRRTGWPRIVLPGSWRVLCAIATVLAKITGQGRLPGLLRPAVLRARMMPLKYSNERLKQRLGWHQTCSFADAMRSSSAPSAASLEVSDEH